VSRHATVVGNIDTVKITVDDLVADNAKTTIDTDAAKLTLTGVEKLESLPSTTSPPLA